MKYLDDYIFEVLKKVLIIYFIIFYSLFLYIESCKVHVRLNLGFFSDVNILRNGPEVKPSQGAA